jgi:hypothetical protein
MKANNLWWLLLPAALAAVIVLIWYANPNASVNPTTALDAAAILAVVGLASVVIERVLEALWNLVDMSLGTFWPMNAVGRQIKDQVNALNQPLAPFFKELTDAVSRTDARIQGLSAGDVKNLQNNLTTLQSVAARNGSLQLFSLRLSQTLADLQKKSPQAVETAFAKALEQSQPGVPAPQVGTGALDTYLDAVKKGAADLDDFVKSFSDNPGRRIVSLFLGGLLGLAAAWVFNLDLLATVLKTGQPHALWLGIVMSGLVIGLGSSPAHEIIQAINNWRQSQGANPSSR